MRRVYPTPASDVDLTEEYAYPAWSDRPWVRAVFISSVDGAATVEERSGGLAGPADRDLFGALRALADVVLVGAGTVRSEEYGPVDPDPNWGRARTGRAPTPPIAVVSKQLDLDPSSALFTLAPRHARTIVITCREAPQPRVEALHDVADLVIAGDERVDLREAVRALAERGHHRIQCEGGPRLFAQLVQAVIVDELCLTLSPVLLAGDAARITDTLRSAGKLPLQLISVLKDENYVFLRYLRLGAGVEVQDAKLWAPS